MSTQDHRSGYVEVAQSHQVKENYIQKHYGIMHGRLIEVGI